MFRGNRGVILAAVGWIILGATQPDKGVNTEQPQHGQPTSHTLQPSPAPLQRAPEPDNRDPGCEEGQENRKSDLCAQWKAADAAKESADWTRRTFWLGCIGAVIGAATLLAAAFAAWYAKAAASHTETGANEAKRAADAAEKSLELSREVAQSDLRAWVDIDLTLDACSRNEKFASITVKIDLTNIGKTPALRTALSVKAYVTPSVVENYGVLPSTDETSRPIAPILPGKTADGKVQARIKKEDIAAGVAKARESGFEPIIIIDAIVHYHTIFDAEDSPKRLTSIRYIMLNTIQRGPQFREARMGWLDKTGPVEAAQTAFERHRGAPIYLT